MKKTGMYLAAVLLLSFTACNKQKTENQTGEIPVQVIQVHSKQGADKHHYIGTLEEKTATSLSFQVPGNIERILVNEGQRVSKGQNLAILDKANLEQTWLATQATLNQAEDAHKRLKILHDNQSLSDIKWVESETKLQQAQSQEAIARRNLDEAVLKSPAAGVIGKRLAEVGENVMPGTPVLTLLDIQDIQVKIAVPENEISRLNKDQEIQLMVGALGNATFTGSITEKGITAHPLSHTYEVKGKIEDPDQRLLPGMVCRVQVAKTGDTGRANVFVLPNNIIQLSHTGERFVWCMVDGRARATRVQTGELTDEGILVTNGLQEGDLVVTDGYHKISENMRITSANTQTN